MRNQIWWGAVFFGILMLLELYRIGLWYVRQEKVSWPYQLVGKKNQFSVLRLKVNKFNSGIDKTVMRNKKQLIGKDY